MKALAVLVAVLALPFVSIAPASAAEPLTDETIQATIETMRELRPVMEKHQDALDELITEEERADLDPCSPPEKVRQSEAYRDMEAVVRGNGFASGEEWCHTAQRITAAYAAVKIEAEEPQWREKMADVRQQIETAPNLSPEQKDQLLAQLEESTAVIGAQDAPAEDKAAVKANLPAIERALEEAYPQQ